MTVQIQLRRGTAADWTSNGSVVLTAGEPGFETDTGKFKVGDGATAWTALPYAGGLESLRLQDLSNVASTSPSSGEVLKWNGTAWEPAADSTGGGGDGNTTYAISSETATGGVNLRLTGSDSTTDDVKLAEGANVTITRTDANTITIASTGTGGAADLGDLGDVVITGTPSNGQVLKYDSGTSKWVNGTDDTGGGGDGNTTYTVSAETATGGVNWRLTGSDSTSDDVKLAEGSNVTITRTDDSTITISAASGGGALSTRTTANGATSLIGNGATESVNITGFKGYILYKIETDAAAWVRVYTDASSRTADASRAEGVDPTPGSGVIAEVITTGAETILISPGTIGFNNETSPTTAIPLAITNKTGGTAAITVTLTILQIEA